jgi:hypothetical protein
MTGGRSVTTTDAPFSEVDRDRVLAVARDYIESWLDGDPERMGRALHPDLAKRSVEPDGSGDCTISNATRDDMVAATREGRGTRYERPYEASILDAFGDVASVRVFSSVYMDYLHVARCGEEWRIVNVLWQRRPRR